MPLQFSYEITSVDVNAKCMMVLYTAEGKTPVSVGVKIPYKDENLEDTIISFCPVAYWESQEKTIQNIEQGTKGTLLISKDNDVLPSIVENKTNTAFFDNVVGSIPSEEIR